MQVDLYWYWYWVKVLLPTRPNSSANFPSYPPDNHHCSDDVYWSGWRIQWLWNGCVVNESLLGLLVQDDSNQTTSVHQMWDRRQRTLVSTPQFMPATINRASWFSTDFNSLFISQRRTVSISASVGRHRSRGRPPNRKWDTYTHRQTDRHRWVYKVIDNDDWQDTADNNTDNIAQSSTCNMLQVKHRTRKPHTPNTDILPLCYIIIRGLARLMLYHVNIDFLSYFYNFVNYTKFLLLYLLIFFIDSITNDFRSEIIHCQISHN